MENKNKEIENRDFFLDPGSRKGTSLSGMTGNLFGKSWQKIGLGVTSLLLVLGVSVALYSSAVINGGLAAVIQSVATLGSTNPYDVTQNGSTIYFTDRLNGRVKNSGNSVIAGVDAGSATGCFGTTEAATNLDLTSHSSLGNIEKDKGNTNTLYFVYDVFVYKLFFNGSSWEATCSAESAAAVSTLNGLGVDTSGNRYVTYTDGSDFIIGRFNSGTTLSASGKITGAQDIRDLFIPDSGTDKFVAYRGADSKWRVGKFTSIADPVSITVVAGGAASGSPSDSNYDADATAVSLNAIAGITGDDDDGLYITEEIGAGNRYIHHLKKVGGSYKIRRVAGEGSSNWNGSTFNAVNARKINALGLFARNDTGGRNEVLFAQDGASFVGIGSVREDTDADGVADLSDSCPVDTGNDGDSDGYCSGAQFQSPKTGANDCNDASGGVYPGATETCNGIDDDCDGSADEGVLVNFYQDLDSDTFGNPGVSTLACSAPGGFVANNTDCNDSNAAIKPGQAEVCDGVDQDCDSSVDEGVTTTFYQDSDGDGFGNNSVTQNACNAPTNYVANNTDCNDSNAAIKPTATEVCDGVDNNCSGGNNEGTPDDDSDGTCNELDVCPDDVNNDQDSDGYCVGLDSNAPKLGGGDCNATNANIHPGKAEVCDGVDQDCDSTVDESPTDATIGNSCNNGVGSCQAAGTIACISGALSCNATPGTPGSETCNGIDDDCNGAVDNGLTFSNFYQDSDGDGFGNPSVLQNACAAPSNYVANNTDCNDAQASIKPGAAEVCDGVDQDCDSVVDDSPTNATIGNSCNSGVGACQVAGTIACISGALSCNATPGSPSAELCNGTDDDCDGTVDDNPTDATFGNACSAGVGACNNAGTIACTSGALSCNATAGTPATEICNGLDDDCDGSTDEGGVQITLYFDADGDTYGVNSNTIQGCTPAGGYVVAGNDCNDASATINPGAAEVCDGIDNNCVGGVDNSPTDVTIGNSCSAGVGACQNAGTIACTSGALSCSATAGTPGSETCNGLDDDCDGQTDEGTLPQVGQSCPVTNGACSTNGVYICNGSGGITCQPPTEICNGLDDDCDLQTDELPITTVGDACTIASGNGHKICTGGTGIVCDVETANSGVLPEMCANGIDDDQDGLVDEPQCMLNILSDFDSDGVVDINDNCPVLSNSSQLNTDSDSMGDVCDTDDDGDTVADGPDNCPLVSNVAQTNTDGDAQGDVCDTDDDGDTVLDDVDNCILIVNTNQANHDNDALGDVCDPDDDNDTLLDGADNCPIASNSDQANIDSDGTGDACDTCTDTDGDTFGNGGFSANTCTTDNCPSTSNISQANLDNDSQGDVCDTCTDADGDGFGNPGFVANTCTVDNCPSIYNPTQADVDGDTIGDICDTDDDGDTVLDSVDNCISVSNISQIDTDADTIGNACDVCPSDNLNDPDSDAVCNSTDNCPLMQNTAQTDTDTDGIGDTCDGGGGLTSAALSQLTQSVLSNSGGSPLFNASNSNANTASLPMPVESNMNTALQMNSNTMINYPVYSALNQNVSIARMETQVKTLIHASDMQFTTSSIETRQTVLDTFDTFINMIVHPMDFDLKSVAVGLDDIKADPNYTDIAQLYREGAVSGTLVGDKTFFYPKRNVNRAEALKMIYGAFNLPVIDANESHYVDVPEDSWLDPYVDTAVRDQVISNNRAYFNGDRPINRAEALSMLYRALEVLPDEEPVVFVDVRDNEWFIQYLYDVIRFGLFGQEESAYFFPGQLVTRSELAHLIVTLRSVYGEGPENS